MLQDLILILISIVVAELLCRKPSESTEEEKNYYEKAGEVTYEFFMKWGTNDYEMKKLLLANDQDLKEFEGCSRLRICEKMKVKAQMNGREYTRHPM